MKVLVTPPFLSTACEDKEGTQSWSKAVSTRNRSSENLGSDSNSIPWQFRSLNSEPLNSFTYLPPPKKNTQKHFRNFKALFSGTGFFKIILINPFMQFKNQRLMKNRKHLSYPISNSPFCSLRTTTFNFLLFLLVITTIFLNNMLLPTFNNSSQ